MAKYLLLKHYRGAKPIDCAPMDQWTPDEVTAHIAFMRQVVHRLGQTIVMVTHDPIAASYADRALFLADGRIVDDLAAPTADAVLDRMRTLGEQ